MAKIPQDIIERVRDSADIVDVVSQYVELKQRGANYFGLCPFHSEKTPSFSVAPAKQIYHCFGCNSGGNVFSFIMEYQKIPFPEAIKILADRYNIPIELEKATGSSELFAATSGLASDSSSFLIIVCMEFACSGVAVLPVPMAQIGSYATTQRF